MERAIVRQCRSLPVEQTIELPHSKLHEERLTVLLILVDRFERSKVSEERRRLVDHYLDELDQVNNWDLVDRSVPRS